MNYKQILSAGLIGLLVLVLLISCSKDPVSTNKTNNSEINIELLFEHDGCKVYRFYDAGYRQYFVKCDSSSTQQTMRSWYQSTGKTGVTRNQRIITEFN